MKKRSSILTATVLTLILTIGPASAMGAMTLSYQKTWGGFNNDNAEGVAVAPDGSVYVAGDTNSFFANDAFLLKYTPDGDIVWERDWREGTIEDISGALGVATGPDGSVYVTGLASINQVGQNIFLLKFDPAGGLVWEKTWGARLDAALGVAVGPDGNIYVTGNTGYGEGNGDAFVVKFLPNGKVRHASTWGGADNESGQAIAVGADGAVYVAGVASAPPYVFDRAPTRTRTPDAFLGTPAGTVTAPAASQTGLAGTVLTPDGSETFAGATDAFLLKILP